jgi:hypothetical protein
VATGATSVVKGRYSNAQHSVDAAEVAIAGKRVAWTKRQQFGNHEASERLYTAAVGGAAHLIGSAYIGNGHTGWIGGVVGSGNVLAVSTWSWNDTVSTRQRLDLVTANGLRPIHTGTGTIVAVAADGGQIAVFRSTAAWPQGPADWSPPPETAVPTVGVYSAGGALLGEVAPSAPSEVALRGDRLIVLTRTHTVDVYDWKTGALARTWPVAASGLPQDLAVYGRLAVYALAVGCRGGSVCLQLHLLDLTSGSDVLIATTSYAARNVAIGSRGLVYAVNSYPSVPHPQGKLVFVPTAKLLAKVG